MTLTTISIKMIIAQKKGAGFLAFLYKPQQDVSPASFFKQMRWDEWEWLRDMNV